jgi:hypothetical protein
MEEELVNALSKDGTSTDAAGTQAGSDSFAPGVSSTGSTDPYQSIRAEDKDIGGAPPSNSPEYAEWSNNFKQREADATDKATIWNGRSDVSNFSEAALPNLSPERRAYYQKQAAYQPTYDEMEANPLYKNRFRYKNNVMNKALKENDAQPAAADPTSMSTTEPTEADTGNGESNLEADDLEDSNSANLDGPSEAAQEQKGADNEEEEDDDEDDEAQEAEPNEEEDEESEGE